MIKQENGHYFYINKSKGINEEITKELYDFLKSDARQLRYQISKLQKHNVISVDPADLSESNDEDDDEEELEDDEEEEISVDSAITPLSDIKKALNYMIQQAESNGDMLNMGSAKSQLQREFADFDERNYGYSLFRKFIEEDTKFIVEVIGSSAFITRKKQEKKVDSSNSVEAYIIDRAGKNIELGVLGKELQKKFPSFKYKELGYSKLSKYVQSVSGVDIKKDGNKWRVVR